MSNIIKPASYISIHDKKLIDIVVRNSPHEEDKQEESTVELDEITQIKEQIIHDAESFAQEIILNAQEDALRLKEQAQGEIEAWWMDKRSEDDQFREEAKQSGYEEGYQAGFTQANEDVHKKYEDNILESETVLQKAQQTKQQIISEAEPFLIEMSIAIAEKIIHHQLSISQEWTVDLIKKQLSRKREQGVITLCVSPEHFIYIQNSHDELKLTIDSQTELLIIPDSTINDHGCVIRTTYGSIDARIDTQLTQIKTALQQIAVRNEEHPDHE